MISRLACFLAIWVVSPMLPQSNGGGAAALMLSPTVVATWFADQPEGAERVQLRLLVLWRGTPAWFLVGGGEVQGGSYRTNGQQQTIQYGNVFLRLSFDPKERVAIIQGKRVELKDDNVVLVDDVDSPAGPRVVSTMRLGPAMPGSAGQLGEMLAPNRAIVDYLRCDAQAPGGRGQAMLEKMCLQNIGVRGKRF